MFDQHYLTKYFDMQDLDVSQNCEVNTPCRQVAVYLTQNQE